MLCGAAVLIGGVFFLLSLLGLLPPRQGRLRWALITACVLPAVGTAVTFGAMALGA